MPLTFGQAMREAMTITPAEVSRKSGISEASISRMLDDNQSPTLAVVHRLEKALPKLKALRNRITT